MTGHPTLARLAGTRQSVRSFRFSETVVNGRGGDFLCRPRRSFMPTVLIYRRWAAPERGEFRSDPICVFAAEPPA